MSERSFDEVSYDVPLPPRRMGIGPGTPARQLPDLPEPPASLIDEDSFWFEMDPDAKGRKNGVTGLAGIGGAILGLAVLLPLEMELVQDMFSGNPPFWMIILVFQTLLLPVVTVSAFVIAVPMFWYISVFMRFLTAVALFVPAVITFFLMLSAVSNGPSLDETPVIVMVFAAAFSASAVVGVLLQMTTPWSLTHNRFRGEPLPRLGTRTLFELTAVIAVVLAIVRMLDVDGDLSVVCLVFAAIGGSGALTGILACIGFLRDGENKPKRFYSPWIIAVTAALFTSGVLVASLSIASFGWNSIFNQLTITLPLTATGAVIVLAVMYACLWWLRQCGWRVVR